MRLIVENKLIKTTCWTYSVAILGNEIIMLKLKGVYYSEVPRPTCPKFPICLTFQKLKITQK